MYEGMTILNSPDLEITSWPANFAYRTPTQVHHFSEDTVAITGISMVQSPSTPMEDPEKRCRCDDSRHCRPSAPQNAVEGSVVEGPEILPLRRRSVSYDGISEGGRIDSAGTHVRCAGHTSPEAQGLYGAAARSLRGDAGVASTVGSVHFQVQTHCPHP
jgi:hypothetical protein